jgi:hypothetical protein
MTHVPFLKGVSFDNMSIDQFTDRINIKELTLTEPAKKPELHFDPAREISSEEWENAKKMLWESRVATNVQTPPFGKRLASMLILFPERKGELDVPPFDEMEGINSVFAEDMKLFYPDKITEEVVERKNSGYNFQKIKKIIGDNKDDESYWLTYGGSFLWDSFILYPERFGEIKALPDLADTLQKAAETRKRRIDVQGFAEYKLYVKLLGRDPEVSDEEWKMMLRRFRPQPSYCIDLGANLKMLEAREIKMSPQGLQVIMPEDENQLVDVSPAVPERRKF